MPENAATQIRAALDPRTEPSRGHLIFWRVLTLVSWLLIVLTAFYYNFRRPEDGDHHGHKWHRHTIWGQNRYRHTPFSLNPIIGGLYWLALFIIQIPYLYSLYAHSDAVTPSLQLAHAFTFSNLLGFGFIHLWVRSYFWWALLLVVLNWFNLTFTYFRYPKSPKLTHVAVLTGPLAWTFVALYWDGAAAVHSHHFAARVVANIFVWTWLVYGGFYLVAFKDWSMGFCLSILAAALGVSQFLTVIVALQWIFAFTIMAALFVGSVIVAFPEATGINIGRGTVVNEDRERAPLLANEA